MLTNYHTHTDRCHHTVVKGPDEAYVQAAVEAGYVELGFSDHTPWPYTSDYRNTHVRMDITQLPDYFDSVHSLTQKYADRLKIYCALECEYFPEYLSWLREIRTQVDYLLLGNHHYLSDEHGYYFGRATDDQSAYDYLRTTVAGMETGLFVYLAHPDLGFQYHDHYSEACLDAARQLCRAAKALNIPLEYNLLGYNRRLASDGSIVGYTCPTFWEIAREEGCTTIVGVDAHSPAAISDTELLLKSRQHLRELGFTVLEQLPL